MVASNELTGSITTKPAHAGANTGPAPPPLAAVVESMAARGIGHSRNSDGAEAESADLGADAPTHIFCPQEQPYTRALSSPAAGIAHYESDGADRYARQCWVREVARGVCATLSTYRPFCEEDIIVDFGGGPGITLEEIFYSKSVSAPTVGRTAYLCDAAGDMVRKSTHLATYRCPVKGVRCQQLNPFSSSHDAEVSAQFQAWLPYRVDVAYSSLVCEYLSWQQIENLTLTLWAKIPVHGIIGLFEWAEHFPYGRADGAGIHHPAGISKAAWLALAGRVTEAIEAADARLAGEGIERLRLARSTLATAASAGVSGTRSTVRAAAGGASSVADLQAAGQEAEAALDAACIAARKFPSKPPSRVEVHVGTFDVESAGEAAIPSGDAVHYLILKRTAVPAAPSTTGVLRAEGATAFDTEVGFRAGVHF
jgi:hypothetical protein